MTGDPDLEYDHECQTVATPKVVESWGIMADPREYISALESAQTSTFQGHEEGPTVVRVHSANMFDTASELLNRETVMLRGFEEEMHAAMIRFTGTGHENALGFKGTRAGTEAQPTHSKKQDEYAVLLHKIGSISEDVIYLPVDSGTSTTVPQSSSGGVRVSTGSGPVT